MPSQTNEQALEATIQKRLAGTCLEELKKLPTVRTFGNTHKTKAGKRRKC